MSDVVTEIKAATRLLASNAEEQIAWLDKRGLKGIVDELALNFNDFVHMAKTLCDEGEITKKQYDLMLRLDRKLDEMSGQEHAELWTEESLRESVEWADVRRIADECLAAFEAV